MKKIYTLLVAGMFLASCANTFNDLTPSPTVMPTPNITIEQLKSLFNNGATNIPDSVMIEGKKIKSDTMVIGGRIISNDQFGNFYRSFFMEDETGAIEVKIGSTGIYNMFPTGSYVCVNVKGMTLGNYPKGSTVKATVSLGAADPTGEYENSYIEIKPWIKRAFFRGDINRAEIDTVQISSLNPIQDAYLGKLIRFNGILAAPNYTTWAHYPLPTGTTAGAADYGQQAVTPTGSSLPNGTTLIIRTSPYCKFAGKAAYPNGTSVRITGILTKFNSTYQIVLNTDEDVKPLLL